MRIPFLGPTYNSRSPNIACDRSINWYPEINSQDSKDVIAMIGTPGTTYFTGTGSLPVRGMHAFNNLLYTVIGNTLYSVNTAGVYSAPLGTLTTSSGRVQMTDNGLAANGLGGNQLMVVDGQNGYIWNALTATFTQISGGGWPGNPSHVIYLDGYFIITVANSMISYASNLFDGLTWNALAYAQATSSKDNLQTLADLSEQIWFIKNNTSECWYNNGVATTVGFPFSRVTAGVLDAGTPAPWSVARLQSNLFMLGSVRNNELGQMVGIVMLANGAYSVVSPVAINYQISQWPRYDDAFGYCYSEGGHSFYVLTSPSGNQTFVYDATTQMCHERSTYDNNPYQYGRHLSNCYVFFNGKHYVGDWQSGNIYEMNSNTYTDNLQPLISVRVAQHLSDKITLNNMFFKRLIIDAETGPPGITGTGGFYNITIPAYNSQADSNTVLLLEMKGTNGSTNFVDMSNNNYPITANGNAQMTTLVYKFPAVGSSLKMDGSNGTFITAPPIVGQFGTSNWTVDGWALFNTLPVEFYWYGQYTGIQQYQYLGGSFAGANGQLYYRVANAGPQAAYSYVNTESNNTNMVAGQWMHFEVARNGTNILFFLNGNLQTSNAANRIVIGTNSIPSMNTPFNIGTLGANIAPDANAYFSEIRVSNSVRHIANFTPPAAPFITYYPAQVETLQSTANSPYWLNSQAALSWSDDGGHTWSNDYLAPMGAVGQYKARLIWRRLGYSRDRVFRIAMSEPTKKVLIGAVVEGGE